MRRNYSALPFQFGESDDNGGLLGLQSVHSWPPVSGHVRVQEVAWSTQTRSVAGLTWSQMQAAFLIEIGDVGTT